MQRHLSKAVHNQLYKRVKVKTQPYNSFRLTKLSFICFKKLAWLHGSWEGVGIAEVVGSCKGVTVHDEEGEGQVSMLKMKHNLRR